MGGSTEFYSIKNRAMVLSEARSCRVGGNHLERVGEALDSQSHIVDPIFANSGCGRAGEKKGSGFRKPNGEEREWRHGRERDKARAAWFARAKTML